MNENPTKRLNVEHILQMGVSGTHLSGQAAVVIGANRRPSSQK
jgi:hypothetical protein